MRKSKTSLGPPIQPLAAMRRFAYSSELRAALVPESAAMTEVIPRLREDPEAQARLVAYVKQTLSRFPSRVISGRYPAEDVSREFAGVLDLVLGVPAEEWLERYEVAA
jgi:hypothetical protein